LEPGAVAVFSVGGFIVPGEEGVFFAGDLLAPRVHGRGAAAVSPVGTTGAERPETLSVLRQNFDFSVLQYSHLP